MPFALSLYNKNNYDTIYFQIKTSYDQFVTSVSTKNIFCYLPVYIDYKKIRDFLNFYSDKDLGTVYHSGGTYNAIPVYAIDVPIISKPRNDNINSLAITLYFLSLNRGLLILAA